MLNVYTFAFRYGVLNARVTDRSLKYSFSAPFFPCNLDLFLFLSRFICLYFILLPYIIFKAEVINDVNNIIIRKPMAISADSIVLL